MGKRSVGRPPLAACCRAPAAVAADTIREREKEELAQIAKAMLARIMQLPSQRF